MIVLGAACHSAMLYPAWPAEENMNDGVELNRFLSEVERKAFYLARSSLGNDEDALDAVQDAMFTLARCFTGFCATGSRISTGAARSGDDSSLSCDRPATTMIRTR